MNIYLLSKEVTKATDELNILAHKKGVKAPKILFSALEASDKLGYYDPSQDLIVLTEELLGDAATEMRENVFLHELAHYVDYLHNHNSAHDATFGAICNGLGVDPDYSYAVVRGYIEKKQNMQKKVEKLVALSSSDFEGEAESAINKAKALMEKYSIDYTTEGKEEIYGIDFHKDGQVNYTEFLAAMTSSIETNREEKEWSAFKYFEDNNSPGYITYNSLLQTCQAFKLAINEDEIKKTFEKENQEKINFEMFKKLIEEENE